MCNIESAFAKINRACADMEADAIIIDGLAERIRAHTEAMKAKAPAISLAMGWAK
jgi:hypothetical protein